jgi:hypothetical protein
MAEKVKRTLEVSAKTRIDENAKKRYEHVLAMDFTECTRDDLMEPASRSLRIDWQRLFRANPEMYPEGTVVEIDVKSLLTGGVGAKIGREGALAYVKSNPEIHAAVLALIEAQKAEDATKTA